MLVTVAKGPLRSPRSLVRSAANTHARSAASAVVRFAAIAVVGAALVSQSAVAADPASGASDSPVGWIALFNGKDLTGWTPKIKGHAAGENFGDTFRVEEGLLKVSYDQYEGPFAGRFGHLFFREAFSHYRLRVEYRFLEPQYPERSPGWAIRNSGIMIHGQTPETMRIDQDFPVSLELQLLGGDGQNPRTTGNLCTPGTHVVLDGKLHTPHCTNSSSETFAGGQWVTAEVEVRGGKLIRHWINGQAVLEYTEPQLDPNDRDAAALLAKGAEKMLTRGTISLQSESHPVEFRKVELLQLDP